MSLEESYQIKATELRIQLIETLEKFSKQHPDIPAQVVMASMGELLIHFSITQVGQAHTLHLISHLTDAVKNFSHKLAPQH
ncbi:hypothetical protein ACIPLR_26835 [Herbaspirillum huttiense]|uniref:hypothetical protein n=1 Tax=Herbaspirillum huttiense TaxID=863372 RepID=UPI0037FF7A11